MSSIRSVILNKGVMIESNIKQVMSRKNIPCSGYAMMSQGVKREGVLIEVLNEYNYQEWKETATIILGLKGQWQHTTKEGEQGAKTVVDLKKPKPGYESWLEIMAMVDTHHRKLLKKFKDGAAAWENLEKLYDKAGGSSITMQLRELFQSRLGSKSIMVRDFAKG